LLNGDSCERCESRLCEGIGEEISRERKDEEKRNIYIYIYIMLAERKKVDFLMKI